MAQTKQHTGHARPRRQRQASGRFSDGTDDDGRVEELIRWMKIHRPMNTLVLDTNRLRLVLESTEAVLARIDALSPDDRAQVSPDWIAQMRRSAPDRKSVV